MPFIAAPTAVPNSIEASRLEAKKPIVPEPPPQLRFDLAAELDRYGPQDEGEQHEHERDVEAGEDRGVRFGKRGEHRAAERDEPDFVAVPDRADGVENNAPLFLGFGDRLQNADAEVEAVEDRVARRAARRAG